MSICNRLDLQTLGSQPVLPKTLPDHCSASFGMRAFAPLTAPFTPSCLLVMPMSVWELQSHQSRQSSWTTFLRRLHRSTVSCPDHTKLPVRFQPWNCWGLCLEIYVGQPLGIFMLRSHQNIHPVRVLKSLGIMLRNRCWPTAFHNIIAGNANRWRQKQLVWSTLEYLLATITPKVPSGSSLEIVGDYVEK